MSNTIRTLSVNEIKAELGSSRGDKIFPRISETGVTPGRRSHPAALINALATGEIMGEAPVGTSMVDGSLVIDVAEVVEVLRAADLRSVELPTGEVVRVRANKKDGSLTELVNHYAAMIRISFYLAAQRAEIATKTSLVDGVLTISPVAAEVAATKETAELAA